MRSVFIAAFCLLATTALGQQFVISGGNRSAPLPAGMREATSTAVGYFDFEVSCRHVLRPDDAAIVRLAGWDALVAGGYLPEGADAAVGELSRVSADAKPWTAEQCASGLEIFRANRSADLERIRSLAQ